MAINKQTTFVLIPGAFQRPIYLDGITQQLSRKGYPSTTVQLPSVGAMPPCQSFDPDVDSIKSAIKSVIESGRNAVVVAHSYGAVPATEAVGSIVQELRDSGQHHVGIKMVFVAAYVLLEDQALTAVGTDPYDGRNPPLTPSEVDFEGQYCMLNSQAKQDFYQDLPSQIADELREALQPHSVMSFMSPLTQAAWKMVPSSYVFTASDGAISPAMQHFMVDRAVLDSKKSNKDQALPFTGELGTLELDCGHFGPYYNKVEELTDYLDKVAKDLET